MIEAIDSYYREHNSNVHRGAHTLSQEATALYEGARAKSPRHINAPTREIVFTRNITGAINLVAQSWGQAEPRPRRPHPPDGDGAPLEHRALVPDRRTDRRPARIRRGSTTTAGSTATTCPSASPASRRSSLSPMFERARHDQPGRRDRRRSQGRRRGDADRRCPVRPAPRPRHGRDRRRLLRLHRPQVLRPDRHRRPLRPARTAERAGALRGRRFDDQQGHEGQDHLGRGPGQARSRHPADRGSGRTRRGGRLDRRARHRRDRGPRARTRRVRDRQPEGSPRA